jgi:hypothetical protein
VSRSLRKTRRPAPSDAIGRYPASPNVRPVPGSVEDVELAVDRHQLDAGQHGAADQEGLGALRRHPGLGEQLLRERALDRDGEVPEADLRGEVLPQVVRHFGGEARVHGELRVDLRAAEEGQLPAARLGERALLEDVDPHGVGVDLLRRCCSADEKGCEEGSHDQKRKERPAPKVATAAR